MALTGALAALAGVALGRVHARYGAEEAGEGANLTAALAEKESGA
jgi:hypothetical protein